MTQEEGYQQPAPQQQPVLHQPVHHPQPQPVGMMMGQSKAYITLIIIGIILLMVSGGILALLYVMNSGADIVMMLGIIINEVGVGLLALGLIMGAMKDDSLHHITRLAMIIGMAVVVAYLHLKVVNWSPYW